MILNNAFIGAAASPTGTAPESRGIGMDWGLSLTGAATGVVAGNVFQGLPLYAVACDDTSQGVFARNTFYQNTGAAAFAILGRAQPVVTSCIFNANHIGWADLTRIKDSAAADVVVAPAPVRSIFWQNDLDAVRMVPSTIHAGTSESEDVPLETTLNLAANPMLLAGAGSLPVPPQGSVAERLGIGGSGPSHVKSPWPDLVEENAALMKALRAKMTGGG
jgi:hypothetical protein